MPVHFHFHKEAFHIPFTFNRAVVLCSACDSQVQRRGGCGWTVTTLSMNYSLGQIFQQLYRGSTASSGFFLSLSHFTTFPSCMGSCQTPSRITTSLTPAQNASLFVFKVYTRASMQMIYQLQTEPKNYLSEEQRSISPPVHLVHFSFSINKCFDRHSAAACFLSLVRRERERERKHV